METPLIFQGSQNQQGSEKGQFLRKHCEKCCFYRNSEHTVYSGATYDCIRGLEMGVSGLRSTTFVIMYQNVCLQWSVVFKSSVCHLGKPCITPVFKMVSKTAASNRNVPRNKNACLIFNLCIMFGF